MAAQIGLNGMWISTLILFPPSLNLSIVICVGMCFYAAYGTFLIYSEAPVCLTKESTIWKPNGVMAVSLLSLVLLTVMIADFADGGLENKTWVSCRCLSGQPGAF